MKTIALIFALFSFQTFAEVPEVLAKNMTCAELRDSLANYRTLTVVSKVLLFKKRLTIYQVANCSYDERVQSATFKTSTDRYCSVGEFCETIPSDYSDYGSGSSSGSDSWGSGSTYDGGWSSSGNSSSSGTRGPSYNPPSSETRGPSYNPPSSGTRGPRYCPSC